MKRLIISTVAVMAAFAVVAEESRRVVLVVKDNARSGLPVQVDSLADGFTAALKHSSLQVINPLDDFGHGINGRRQSESLQDESPIGIARRKKAHGLVMVSIDSLASSLIRGPASADGIRYEVCMVFRLVDAWGENTVCSSQPNLPVRESVTYILRGKRDDEQQKKHLGELLRSAGVKCAKELLKDPGLGKWMKSGNANYGGLLAQMKTDPEIRKWIESMIGGKVSEAEAKLNGRLLKVEEQLKKLSKGPRTFDDLVDELAKEMTSNSTFVENYYDLKRAGGRRPIVVFGKLTNATNRARHDAGLKVASEKFLKKLYDSKMFDIVDDSVKIDLAKRITYTSIVEGGDLEKEWKSHNSPDLFVEGEFIFRSELDDTEYYDLILKMHRLRRPGGVVWFGIGTYPVKREVAK